MITGKIIIVMSTNMPGTITEQRKQREATKPGL